MMPPPALEPTAKPEAATPTTSDAPSLWGDRLWVNRLWGGTLVVVGYLLSPLCWWNDLVINLPLALGFGYLASRPWPDALVPMTGVGYWLTNVVGFVLMQQGATTALQKDSQDFSSHALRNGLLTSTVYTVAVVLLIQLRILEMPDFLNDDLLAMLNAWLPDWLMS